MKSIASAAPLLVLATCIVVGCRPSSPATSTPSPSTPPAADVDTGTVTLEINDGDDKRILVIEKVAAGTTLEALMRSIDEVPVTINGSGLTAFVHSIGDRSTGGKEGWIFRVDGEYANEGVGSTKLTPPVTVTWTYGDTGDIPAQ